MKTQVQMHLRQAIDHLLAVDVKTLGEGDREEVLDWLKDRAGLMDGADWSDMEREGDLCVALQTFFAGEIPVTGEPKMEMGLKVDDVYDLLNQFGVESLNELQQALSVHAGK